MTSYYIELLHLNRHTSYFGYSWTTAYQGPNTEYEALNVGFLRFRLILERHSLDCCTVSTTLDTLHTQNII